MTGRRVYVVREHVNDLVDVFAEQKSVVEHLLGYGYSLDQLEQHGSGIQAREAIEKWAGDLALHLVCRQNANQPWAVVQKIFTVVRHDVK